jgi:SAM-dependent methyltransferase
MTTVEPIAHVSEQRDELVQRLFGAAIGTLDVLTVHLGDRLGYYAALAASGPLTAGELAARTGTRERYAREWLEQQAATGILAAGSEPDATRRRFTLPTGHAEALVDEDSLSYMAGMVRLVASVAGPLPAVLQAFRTGGGVPYAAFGPDTREGIAAMNRPMFVNQLGSEWLPAIPELHARLHADPPARVADFGCGTGWSSIAIARAYPKVQVEGIDLDGSSIERARANAMAAGLSARVSFSVRDAADPALAGRFDLVTAFETVHDMARPVEALRAMRGLLRAGGVVLVADERVGEAFSAPGDELERLNYGFSVLHCLPASLADSPSAATGTVMRPPTFRRYAAEAGFGDIQLLPIENDFWQFYRLSA